MFDDKISLLGGEENRTYFRGTQRTHGANDNATHFVFGVMESIPQPQGGFSGWNRICFAICDLNWANLEGYGTTIGNEAGEDPLQFLEDIWPPFDLGYFNWIHGYEGVMLPGERIIIGQYMDMAQEDDRGPFIIWDI